MSRALQSIRARPAGATGATIPGSGNTITLTLGKAKLG